MTTILEEFRKLEEARKRGEIDAADLNKLRQELTDLIEEAEVASADAKPLVSEYDLELKAELVEEHAPAEKTDATHADLMRFAVFAIGGLTLCVLIGAWVFADPMLALTLGVTVLAAVVIRASQQLED